MHTLGKYVEGRVPGHGYAGGFLTDSENVASDGVVYLVSGLLGQPSVTVGQFLASNPAFKWVSYSSYRKYTFSSKLTSCLVFVLPFATRRQGQTTFWSPYDYFSSSVVWSESRTTQITRHHKRLTALILGCCKSIAKMQKVRLNGTQLPITPLLPNRFQCNLQHRVRKSFLHNNLSTKFLFER